MYQDHSFFMESIVLERMLRQLASPLSSVSLPLANTVKELSFPAHCQHPSIALPGKVPFKCARGNTFLEDI